MKTLIVLALLNAVPAFATGPDCGQAQRDLYLDAITQFSVGAITKMDAERARIEHFEAQYSCQAIDRAQFCYESITSNEVIVTNTKEYVEAGALTKADLIRAQENLKVAKESCSNN